MLPLKDMNPTRLTPVVTVVLIARNVAVWILVQKVGTEPGLHAAGQDYAYPTVRGASGASAPERTGP